jgi:hypothetical protein
MNCLMNAGRCVLTGSSVLSPPGVFGCPPADVLLQKLVDAQPVKRADHRARRTRRLLGSPGGRDRFLSAALTARQQTYGVHDSDRQHHTPQMVVDGASSSSESM